MANQRFFILIKAAISGAQYWLRPLRHLVSRSQEQQRTTPRVMEWLSGSTGHFSSSCEHMSTRKMIGTVLTISPLCHRTSVHTSTGCSPFLLMFGRKPSASYLGSQAAYNSNVYQDHIRDKIAELRDFVDTNLAQAATNQKVSYDSKTRLQRETLYNFLF